MKGVIQTKIRGKIGAVIVLGIFTALILAQSVAADDYDTDGDGYVGNGGEERIFFDDDTAEIEMLDANVGIGTTSPDNLLDIEKSGTAKSNLDIFHITNNVNAADMDGTETSILFNQWYYDVSTPAVADAGRITVGTETDWTSTASTQDGYMSFHTVKDGTVSEQARITSDGKVGIGTTGPDARLDILDTSGAQLRLTHTDGTKFCDFQVDSVHDLTIRPSSNGQIKSIPTTDSTDFFQVWNAAQTTPVLNVDTINYRVSIGVSTFPQNTLDVEGAVAIGSTYSGTSSAPSNGAIIEGNVGIGTTSPQNKLDVEGAVAIGATYSGTSSAPSNGAIIEGNVGIGVAIPSTKLHVDGDVAFGAGSTLTINLAGEVTATHSYHQIDTAGGAAQDDLDTIYGGSVPGEILIIRAVDSTRTVKAKDGTGNLVLERTLGDFELDHVDDTLTLIYDGSNWLELSRSDNGV